MKTLEFIITGLILSIFVFLVGKVLYDKNKKFDLRVILAILIYIILFMFNNYTSDFVFTVLLHYISLVLFFEIAFDCSMKEVLLGSLIVYTFNYCILIIIEIFAFIVDINFEGYFILVHFLSSFLMYLFIKKMQKRLKQFIDRTNSPSYKIIAELVFVNIILAVIFVISTNYLKVCSFSPDSWFIIITIIVINLLTAKLIKEENTNKDIIKSYSELSEYSKINEKLIEEYRVCLHENKNQLLIIKSMLNNKCKGALEYIDSVIGSKSMIKYEWLTELSNIPIPEIKGFVNYKVSEMQENNLTVELVISPQIKTVDTSKLSIKEKEDFYNILGVLLDNAKEASLESSDKMVSIIVHKKHKLIKILIANTYKGEIDLERINKSGYSSKGKNRGMGLKIVNDLIDKNPKYHLETTLVQNFFLQTLTIDINRKSSKKDTLS